MLLFSRQKIDSKKKRNGHPAECEVKKESSQKRGTFQQLTFFYQFYRLAVGDSPMIWRNIQICILSCCLDKQHRLTCFFFSLKSKTYSFVFELLILLLSKWLIFFSDKKHIRAWVALNNVTPLHVVKSVSVEMILAKKKEKGEGR